MKRDKWSNRTTFILAAIGSAVGLGNAWRFPGLAAKHGGGAFLLVYLIAMLFIGIPLLMTEIAIGRKVRRGAPGSMRAIGRGAEGIGWMSVSNGWFITVYYAVVFAWVILMFAMGYKFAGMTGDTAAASSLWATTIKTTGTTEGFNVIAWPVVACLVVAWVACWWCIRKGTTSVGKVVKYTVSLPVICMAILAVRGLTLPGAMDGIAKLFVPEWSALLDSSLWIDATGQVFYSLSVAMAIMFAYGSFLKDESNIAVDACIIAFSDMIISVIAGVVMFTTMAGVGMLDNMSTSGISTAFIIYPQAIVLLSDLPWLNALFAYVFYFCLITLAIDSLFSIVEGVSTAVSDKFSLNRSKTTLTLCIIAFVLGLFFTTGAGLGWLDIVDNYVNSYTLVFTGVLEAIAIGWFFKSSKVLDEINRNTKRFRMPKFMYNLSLKFLAPVVLLGLFCWNMYNLIAVGGVYGKADGYSLKANIIGGWSIIVLTILSGLIIRIIAAIRAKKGHPVEQITWDGAAALDAEEAEAAPAEAVEEAVEAPAEAAEEAEEAAEEVVEETAEAAEEAAEKVVEETAEAAEEAEEAAEEVVEETAEAAEAAEEAAEEVVEETAEAAEAAEEAAEEVVEEAVEAAEAAEEAAEEVVEEAVEAAEDAAE